MFVSAPVDLPPPPPQSDPREPSPHVNTRQRIATPSRPRSPVGSRGSSPVRPPTQRSPSSDPTALSLVQPVPHNLSPSSSAVPILPALHHSHPHLSRPSSPSSVTSSTSAIFERDIEHPAVPSLSLNPNPIQTHQLNHKSSRLQHLSHAHGSPLDHTVPAVLDDAVEALTESGTSRGLEGLEIEFPASAVPFTSSRKASTGPQGFMLNSRSSSPVSGASISPAQSPPILNQLWTRTIVPPTGDHSSGGNSPTSMMGGNVPRPSMANREPTGPQLPGGWAFGDGAGGAGDTITTPMAENVSPTLDYQSCGV
jgi:hypothetical protein